MLKETTDPQMLLMEAMLLGTDKMIQRQEKRGQQRLVDADVLPTDGLQKLRVVIEKAGV